MRGIITLCGSTKFREQFEYINAELTKNGFIVLSVGTFNRKEYHSGSKEALALKYQLDDLHFYKIDISTFVFIINKEGYLGFSTLRELSYARKQGKRIFFLEKPSDKDPPSLYEENKYLGFNAFEEIQATFEFEVGRRLT